MLTCCIIILFCPLAIIIVGLINTAGAIPGFVGVYVAGYLLQTFGNWSVVFRSAAAMCFLGSAVFATFASADKII
jgi:hypothetical protein